jgi:hypothetical protein
VLAQKELPTVKRQEYLKRTQILLHSFVYGKETPLLKLET